MYRAVITGMGAITPLGHTVSATWQGMANGVSGAQGITRFNASSFATQFACEVKNFNASEKLDRKLAKRTDPFMQYALVAVQEAIEHSGYNWQNANPYEQGVVWGVGQGGVLAFQDIITDYVLAGQKRPSYPPMGMPKILANLAAGHISMQYNLQGLCHITSAACASSNVAFMDALNAIRLGQAKMVVTGGSEAPIVEVSIGSFNAIKALSTRNETPEGASRPWDAERDGFVMGEGAAAFVLEEYEHAKARGATIYAEVAGAGMTADAYHMTAPHPEGLGAEMGMRRALADARLNPEDIHYLNPHATSTPVGDMVELHAIQRVFPQAKNHLTISATKSMTGHLLGAASAVEALACVQAINTSVVPPTINTSTLDAKAPELPLVLGQARECKVKAALSNAFGFGGHNCIVVFKSV